MKLQCHLVVWGLLMTGREEEKLSKVWFRANWKEQTFQAEPLGGIRLLPPQGNTLISREGGGGGTTSGCPEHSAPLVEGSIAELCRLSHH